MDMAALGIPIAFTILAAALLWIIIGGSGHWSMKMGFVAIVLYFSVALWASLGNLIGWSTRDQLPEKFQVHWIIVKEQPPGSKEENSVFMWVTELDDDNKPKEQETHKWVVNFTAKKEKSEPRAHRTRYSKELHKQAMRALGMIRAGKPVVGTRKAVEKALAGKPGSLGDGTGNGQGEGGADGRGRGEGEGGRGNGGSASRNEDPVFHILPPPLLPPKPK
jgi:hypothetical protein